MAHLAPRRTMLAMAVGMAGLNLASCVGREAAPEFSYTLLDGAKASSSALRGRVVLVNFWATSCAVCIQEMPSLVALHRRFQDRGLETLAVAMSHDAPARVSHYAQSRQLPFGVVIDNTGAIASAFWGVKQTPTTYLIDKRGAIAKRYVGEPDFAALQVLVEKLLAEA
jgi:peroxiredoxin